MLFTVIEGAIELVCITVIYGALNNSRFIILVAFFFLKKKHNVSTNIIAVVRQAPEARHFRSISANFRTTSKSWQLRRNTRLISNLAFLIEFVPEFAEIERKYLSTSAMMIIPETSLDKKSILVITENHSLKGCTWKSYVHNYLYTVYILLNSVVLLLVLKYFCVGND